MKHYVLAGGTSGIGLALTQQLQQAGHQLTLFSRNGDPVSGMDRVQHHAVDFSREGPDKSLLPDQIDGLVYCPGTINLKPFRSLKLEDYQEDFNLNVLGAVRFLRVAQKALKKADNASVILFSTVAVQQGMPFHSSVAASKGALEGLTRSLAAEWAPRIRVNCIAPSLIDTPLASKILSSEDRVKASEERHPLRRVGKPEDIASMATYLLSDKASWISGQVLGIDGGLSTLRV